MFEPGSSRLPVRLSQSENDGFAAEEEPKRLSAFETLLRQLAAEHERELNVVRSESASAVRRQQEQLPQQAPLQQPPQQQPQQHFEPSKGQLETLAEDNEGFCMEIPSAEQAPRLLGSSGLVRGEESSRLAEEPEDSFDAGQVSRSFVCARKSRLSEITVQGKGPERPSIASDTSSVLDELLGQRVSDECGQLMRQRDVSSLVGTWELQPMWLTEDDDDGSEESDVARLSEKKLYRMHLARARAYFLETEGDTAELVRMGCQRLSMMPYSYTWSTWQAAVTFLILVDAVIVPLQAFDDDVALANNVEHATWVTSSLWTLAIPISCFVGFQTHDSVELRPSKIMQRYAITWLPIDLLTVSSGWVEILMTGEDSSVGQAVVASRLLKVFRLLRLIRLVRLWRLRQVSNDVEHFFHSQAAKVIIEVLRLMVGMVLTNHMLACAWYAIGRQTGGWIGRYSEFMSSSLSHRYAASYHWSLTQFHGSTSMDAENEIERWYSVAVLTMALFFVSIMLSTITNLMMQLQSESAAKLNRSVTLNRYLMQNKISSPLAMRVKKCMKWAEAKVERTGGEAFLPMLPSILQKELHYEICKPWISIHPLFFMFYRKYKRSFWHICIKAVTQYTVMPHEQVFREGLDSHYMIFITEGHPNYRLQGSEEMQLGPCRTMCEASLWTKWVHIGVLATTEPACMLRLNSTSFSEVVAGQTSEVLRSTRAYAQKFVTRLRRLPAEEITDLFTLD